MFLRFRKSCSVNVFETYLMEQGAFEDWQQDW